MSLTPEEFVAEFLQLGHLDQVELAELILKRDNEWHELRKRS